MRIGLLGFTFSNANKGCEALTYSFMYTMNSIYGDKTEFRYYSYSSDYGYVSKYFPNNKFTNFALSRKRILTKLKDDFKCCDAIVDISYGDGFADIYNPKGVFWNTIVKQVAISSGRPLILLPQTYGPFNNKLLQRQAALAIKGAKAVFSRDILSTEYIKKISGVDAETVTDLAFTLPFTPPQPQNDNRIRVGINVSGLLWKGGFYKDNQFGLRVDYPKYIEMIIEKLLSDISRYEIHLIPHVIENIEGSNDGDLYVNDLLKEKYPELIVAPAFKDPIETKNYIAGLDVLTAARMHATVDAFSSGVPVIPFAYSRKFEGLYGSIGYNYIVDGKKLDTVAAAEQTLKWIENRELLKTSLCDSKAFIDEKTAIFKNKLVDVISNTECV